MKTNTVLVAMTFVLGSLLTLVLMGQLAQSVRAQDAGDGAVKGVSALTVSVGSNKELLVVLKEVDSVDKTGGEGSGFGKVTAMAVYDFVNANGGSGRGKATLVASRYLEYDFNLVEFNNERGVDTGYQAVKKLYSEVETMLKEAAAKGSKK